MRGPTCPVWFDTDGRAVCAGAPTEACSLPSDRETRCVGAKVYVKQ